MKYFSFFVVALSLLFVGHVYAKQGPPVPVDVDAFTFDEPQPDYYSVPQGGSGNTGNNNAGNTGPQNGEGGNAGSDTSTSTPGDGSEQTNGSSGSSDSSGNTQAPDSSDDPDASEQSQSGSNGQSGASGPGNGGNSGTDSADGNSGDAGDGSIDFDSLPDFEIPGFESGGQSGTPVDQWTVDLSTIPSTLKRSVFVSSLVEARADGRITQQELDTIVAQTEEQDERVVKITIKDKQISVTFLQPAKLFWLIPVSYTQEVEVDIAADNTVLSVSVDEPWWLVFAKNKSGDELSTVVTKSVASMAKLFQPQTDVEHRAFATAAIYEALRAFAATAELEI